MKFIKLFIAPFTLLYQALDRRMDLSGFIERNLTGRMIPTKLCLLSCFGGFSFIICLVQFITGIVLTFFYHPTADEAFSSIQYIRHEIPLGWLTQKAHAVGPHLLVVLIMIHMTRIFYKGIFHRPREMHWISGCMLLLVTFLFAFTGSMLPNHLERWQPDNAATIATDPSEQSWVGALWEENKLTVVYIVHILLLPLIMVVFLGVHFVMIRRTGISEPL